MRLLLIDDDKKLVRVLKKILESERYLVDVAYNGSTGQVKALKCRYDAIILDIAMPERDGLEVCAALRSAGLQTPVIMLTGRITAKDRVTGLDLGADDYVPKPFSPSELLARLRAVLRRPDQALPTLLRVADLELNPVNHAVNRGSQQLALMPKEYSLLEFMMRRPNEVITREELLHHVWGTYYSHSSNRLEVYIRYLREKIDDPHDRKLIKTVRGTGYMLADGAA